MFPQSPVPAQKELIPQQCNADEVVSYEKLLTQYLNYWRNRLVERTIAYHEAVARRRANPKETVNTNGGPMTITTIVAARVAPVVEASAAVKTIEEMLASKDFSVFFSEDKVMMPLDLGDE